MENRKESYDPKNILGLKENSIILDVTTPIGTAVSDQVSSIIAVTTIDQEGCKEETTNLLVIGMLNSDRIVTNIVDLVCGSIEEYLDEKSGLELLTLIHEMGEGVLIKKIREKCDNEGISIETVTEELDKYMEEVIERYGIEGR